jgi:hypothetical protein
MSCWLLLAAVMDIGGEGLEEVARRYSMYQDVVSPFFLSLLWEIDILN